MTLPAAIMEFWASEARRIAYQEWLRLPMTQELLRLGQQLTRPVNLDNPQKGVRGRQALYHYGVLVGFDTARSFYFDLPSMVAAADKMDKAAALDADYGAAEIARREREGDL